MTQQQCLQQPTHWTHYGICYPGNATIQLHSANGYSVPEPSTLGLFMLAAIMSALFARRSRHA